MTNLDLNTLEPVYNPDAAQFEIQLGEDMAVLQYKMDGNTIVMHHTEVPTAFEGQGIAGKLTKYALDWAKREGYKVNPTCPYVQSYIQRYPEYQDNAWGF